MFQQILNQLAIRERQITLDRSTVIKESLEMVQFLKNLLKEAKGEVQQRGFTDQAEEIHFFREVQPQMVSRLIFYNEIYKIESKAILLSIEAAKKFLKDKVRPKWFKESEILEATDFFSYIALGRTNRDVEYFTRNYDYLPQSNEGYLFSFDGAFSTSRSFEVAKIKILLQMKGSLWRRSRIFRKGGGEMEGLRIGLYRNSNLRQYQI